MSDNKSVISGEFDRTDRYEAGLKSLANSLRAAFFILLLNLDSDGVPGISTSIRYGGGLLWV